MVLLFWNLKNYHENLKEAIDESGMLNQKYGKKNKVWDRVN